ncbi:achaete-scute homolog 1b-like [Watersipora subatra]|uniref:achaete-scute homolog 1b-like n=1 Tax=Watersipora subatra TaxID=2589382 RepID=UPI00355AD441
MTTLQLTNPITIAGTTYSTAQVFVVSPQRPPVKTILPKQEQANKEPAKTNLKLDCPKRRIHFSKKALTHPRPQSITRRNTRERNRVRAVNQGFVTLANHVPLHLRSKKMSKVDTLKAAMVYIQELTEALDNTDAEDDENMSCSDQEPPPLLDCSQRLCFTDSPTSTSSYSESPVFDSYSDGFSSPESSIACSPPNHQGAPPYYSQHPSYHPASLEVPIQTPYQYSHHSPLPYTQNVCNPPWPTDQNPYPAIDENCMSNEEENILDMISWMF